MIFFFDTLEQPTWMLCCNVGDGDRHLHLFPLSWLIAKFVFFFLTNGAGPNLNIKHTNVGLGLYFIYVA